MSIYRIKSLMYFGEYRGKKRAFIDTTNVIVRASARKEVNCVQFTDCGNLNLFPQRALVFGTLINMPAEMHMLGHNFTVIYYFHTLFQSPNKSTQRLYLNVSGTSDLGETHRLSCI